MSEECDFSRDTQYEDAQAERLKKEKQQILEERGQKYELMQYVEKERTAEQRWREVGLNTRLRWKVFGMDSTDDTKQK